MSAGETRGRSPHVVMKKNETPAPRTSSTHPVAISCHAVRLVRERRQAPLASATGEIVLHSTSPRDC